MERNEKIWENVIIVVLIGIVVCMLTPIIQTIFFKSQVSSAKNNAENMVDMVELLYSKASMKGEVFFPFIVVFGNGDYTIYSGSDNKIIDETIDYEGKLPISGTIIMYNNGSISITNLKYDDIICNKQAFSEVQCIRS